MRKILICGAGGFIGSHLVKRLKSEGNYVYGVDLKYPEFEQTVADKFYIMDLRYASEACKACHEVDDVYQLAADMGGIGYITEHHADIARNNTLININMLDAAVTCRVKRYLYTSSACVYPHDLQTVASVMPLREEDAIPAQPEPGYGWEKLYAEQLVQYYAQDYGLDTRIVRFHNVYGPLGTYDGGKEKSPAALCRKIAKAVPNGEIEIWGDGNQTRTYMHISDCIEGLYRIMGSGYTQPLNLGTNQLITINELALLIARVANKPIILKHVDGPQGVRGRSSDNTRIKEVLGWEPKMPLSIGLRSTYDWINKQINS